MLTKIQINKSITNIKIDPLLLCVIKYDFIPNSIYFTNGKIVINNKSNYSYKFINNKIIKLNKINRIPIKFNNILIWKQLESFDQNNKTTANYIRNYVISLLQNSTASFLMGIGGEYYGYFCSLNKYDKYIGYTNNKYIHQDAIFNMELYYYYKNYNNYIMNYNNIKQINNIFDSDCIINLSIIPLKIITFINNNKFNKIIIISCKKKTYKRVKMLNYKIKKIIKFDIITIYFLINSKNIKSLQNN
jgi:hypothetical protein